LCSRAPRTEIWVSIGSASFRFCSSVALGDAAGQRRFGDMGIVRANCQQLASPTHDVSWRDWV
jgi:hypothetical protein